MGNFEKAASLYLRGFNSQYIKRRTEISMQSLLKQLKAKDIVYTKDDIINHQINYIRDKYSSDEIKDAYRRMTEEYDDPYELTRGRHIVMLGCAFGNYKKVIQSIIGVSEYKELRNECWKKKQVATMQAKYGISNAFEKEVFHQFVSADAVANGRKKRTETLLARYGVEHPNENPVFVKKMLASISATNVKRYGVPNAMQVSNIAQKSAHYRQISMMEKYGVKNSVEVKAIRDKIFATRKQNNTLNTSRPEAALGELLVAHFGREDVEHNIVVDDRYPYRVDYYIKSLDLFIELNGDRCHNDHWFDESNPRDQQILRSWIENMIRLEAESGKVSRYRKFIKTWSDTDVAKRKCAKRNKLNYLVFWDGSCRRVNKKEVPVLSDVYAWFDAGCPMPSDWLAENTY